MPDVTVAVLDTFHPQITSAIRAADIVFVMVAPMPKELIAAVV